MSISLDASLIELGSELEKIDWYGIQEIPDTFDAKDAEGRKSFIGRYFITKNKTMIAERLCAGEEVKKKIKQASDITAAFTDAVFLGGIPATYLANVLIQTDLTKFCIECSNLSS
ncbi:hypothetical protein [Kordiimonas laminariae]|uniref:hypothetical protein n=1 Tax=Kordiimonas laminariae TaxID=2917717 RepID=UPI001FF270E0|nr:hypothetical protein [Kordiimonas laminariae]MCK0070725.1 hypothetical protein [Kordiimonas laminariae]